MGACDSQLREEVNNSQQISRELLRDKTQSEKVIKLLFIGRKGVGRNTILKQLRLCHGEPYTLSEAKSWVPHIRRYIIRSMQSLLQQCRNQSSLSTEAQTASNHVMAMLEDDDTPITDQVLDDMRHIYLLWNEAIIRTSCSSSRMAYFFDQVGTIQHTNYCPSKEDILMAPNFSNKLTEYRLSTSTRNASIFDLIYPCTQYTNYNKLLHQFGNVNGMVFVADLSQYDVSIDFSKMDLLAFGFVDMYYDTMHIPVDVMTLIAQYCSVYDANSNSVRKQLQMFSDTVNDTIFYDAASILIFNKIDIFTEKVESVAINECAEWTDYDGDAADVSEQIKYFKRLFVTSLEDDTRQVYIHTMCAIDSNNVRKVFTDIEHIMIQS